MLSDVGVAVGPVVAVGEFGEVLVTTIVRVVRPEGSVFTIVVTDVDEGGVVDVDGASVVVFGGWLVVVAGGGCVVGVVDVVVGGGGGAAEVVVAAGEEGWDDVLDVVDVSTVELLLDMLKGPKKINLLI